MQDSDGSNDFYGETRKNKADTATVSKSSGRSSGSNDKSSDEDTGNVGSFQTRKGIDSGEDDDALVASRTTASSLFRQKSGSLPALNQGSNTSNSAAASKKWSLTNDDDDDDDDYFGDKRSSTANNNANSTGGYKPSYLQADDRSVNSEDEMSVGNDEDDESFSFDDKKTNAKVSGAKSSDGFSRNRYQSEDNSGHSQEDRLDESGGGDFSVAEFSVSEAEAGSQSLQGYDYTMSALPPKRNSRW
jgi:hypothetical protein